MHITRCGIHGFHETLGIDVDEFRFFWVIENDRPGSRQVAYRVEVTTDKKTLEKKENQVSNHVWDSGRVESDKQRNILCNPTNGFRSTCSHYWRVTVWDDAGSAYYSAVNHFFTAYPRSSRPVASLQHESNLHAPQQSHFPHMV